MAKKGQDNLHKGKQGIACSISCSENDSSAFESGVEEPNTLLHFSSEDLELSIEMFNDAPELNWP